MPEVETHRYGRIVKNRHRFKRTTAASVAIVGVVVYLALVHLKPILMPLAVAVLLFFSHKTTRTVHLREGW